MSFDTASVKERARYQYLVINSLHNKFDPDPKKHWTPHQSQHLVLKALFHHHCKTIFVQCGRKWGKTEVIIYCLWRWALLNPGQSCYYICPTLKQAREIVWKSRDRRGRLRIQEFGNQEFIQSIDQSEMRITFTNGSFIKVDGSDNFDAWAGISPNMLVLDEFRSFRPEFFTVMNPNRATFDAPMIIIGTPPEQIWIDKDTPHQYVEIAHECRMDMFETGRSFHIKRPSWDNPDPLIHSFLGPEKKRLMRRGKASEWWREYGAELVAGGEHRIFPTFIADPTLSGSQVITPSQMYELMFMQ